MKEKNLEIDEIAKICSTCGNCLFACPVYNAELMEPNSPRGKINMIKSVMDDKLESGRLNKKFIYQCLACGSCRQICPKGVEFVDMMVKYRNKISGGTKIPWLKKVILFFYQSILFKKFIGVVDILSKTPLRKALAIPRRRKPEHKKMFTSPKKGGQYDILLFPGCVLTHFYPALIEKTVAFLKKQGFSVVVPKNLQCCGFPFITQGWQKKFETLRKKNEKVFSAFDFKYLVVPCGTGLMAFRDYYDMERSATAAGKEVQSGSADSQYPGKGTKLSPGEEIERPATAEVYELTEFIYKFAKDAKVNLDMVDRSKGKITYHDPCHDLKILDVEKEPRHFMKQFGKDFVDDKSALCCGFGGIFSVGFPSTSKKIFGRKKSKLDELNAGTVVTSCPGCYYQLRENLPLDVKFFIDLF